MLKNCSTSCRRAGSQNPLLNTVITLAAIQSDDAFYDRLRAKSVARESPADARRALLGLARVTDQKLISRTLEYALAEARNQDLPVLLFQLFQNPASRQATWSFMKEHWSQLREKTDALIGSILTTVTSGFCDPALRHDVEQFFSTHPMPGSDRPLREALESMDNCIRMKAQQAEHLAKWLQAF